MLVNTQLLLEILVLMVVVAFVITKLRKK